MQGSHSSRQDGRILSTAFKGDATIDYILALQYELFNHSLGRYIDARVWSAAVYSGKQKRVSITFSNKNKLAFQQQARSFEVKDGLLFR